MRKTFVFVFVTILLLFSAYNLSGQITESHVSNNQKIIIIKQISIPKPKSIVNTIQIVDETTVQNTSEIASQTNANVATPTASLTTGIGGN